MTRNRENHRAAWTPEQIAELRRLARQNLTAQQVSKALGRTEEAVPLRAKQEGIIFSYERHRRT